MGFSMYDDEADLAEVAESPDHLVDGSHDLTKHNSKHRLTDQIADRYAQHAEHKERAARMHDCGKTLAFDVYRVGDCVDRHRVLANGSFCRERLCPFCMKRNSAWLHVRLTQAVERFLKQNPQHQAVLLTLTMKNMTGEKLRYWLDRLLKAFRKLMRYRRVSAAVSAWYRTTEITRNAETGEFHPHIHLLVFFPPEYFRRAKGLYITQAEWAGMFKKALQVDYTPVCDIRAMPGVGGGAPLDDLGRKSLFEVCKYVCEPGMFFEDDDLEDFPLLELHEALHGRRLIGMSANLQRIIDEQSLPQEAPDDFIPVNGRLPEGAVLEGREIYHWRRGATPAQSRYVLVEFRPWSQPLATTEAVMTSTLPN
jgi:plasmid rolling circle replication initiator protein Rep